MKRPEYETPKSIVVDQVEKYFGWTLLSSVDRKGVYRSGSIGETIARLTPEQRAKLADLKSDDLQNVKHPLAEYSKDKPGTLVFRLPHEKS